MSFISSTTVLVTLSLICLHISTTSGDGTTPAPEQSDLLPKKALDVCKETNTAVCPKGSPNNEPVCDGYAKKANGTDPKCDADNGCSFMLKIKGDDKLLYVSLKDKISSAMPNSTTYKKCENGLILYSLYAPS